MSIVAIILAAGEGERFKSNKKLPKQYEIIHDKTILEHCIDKFLPLKQKQHLQEIIITVNISHKNLYKPILQKYDVKICYGGQRRQDSVINSIDLSRKFMPKQVIIHDAARPFVKKELILETIHQAAKHGSAIPAITSVDAIKVLSQGRIQSIAKAKIRLIQTPQCYQMHLIEQLYEILNQSNAFDDESMALEQTGAQLHLIKGSSSNIKITYLEDLNFSRII